MIKLRVLVTAVEGKGDRHSAEVLAAFIRRNLDPLTRNATLTTSVDDPDCGRELARLFADVEIAVV